MCGAAIDTQEDTANSDSNKELEGSGGSSGGSGTSVMTVNENGDENARAVDDQLEVVDEDMCDDTKEQTPGGLDTSSDDTGESGCGYESSVSPSISFEEEEMEASEPNEKPHNENVDDDIDDENSDFAQLCRALDRNDDASLDSVSIFDFGCLSHPRKALALSQSLRCNTTVRTLHLDFGAVTKWNVHADAAFVWTEFLQTTSNSGTSITALELHQATSPLSCQRRRRTARQQDDGAAACTLLLVILQAISKNASITELTFSNNSSNTSNSSIPSKAASPLPAGTTTTTKSVSSSSSTSWYFTTQIPTTLQTATLQALTECRCIDTLWLEHVEDSVACAMLRQWHQSIMASTEHLHQLQSLVIVPQRRTLSMATAKALGSLLSVSSNNNVSSSLRHVEFHSVRFTFKIVHCLFVATTTTNVSTDQDVNTPTNEELSSSTGLELSLHDCTFDWAATNWVRTNFGHCNSTRASATAASTTNTTTSIGKWTIGRNVKFYGSTASVVVAVLSAPTCGIVTLDLTRCDWGGSLPTPQTLSLITLLTALEARMELLTKTAGTNNTEADQSKAPSTTATSAAGRMLERLLLGSLVPDDVAALQRYIPSLRGLQYLQFQLAVVAVVETESAETNNASPALAKSGHQHPHHELLTALQANTTLATCVINDETFNLFQYPNQELSIYDQIMQGLL